MANKSLRIILVFLSLSMAFYTINAQTSEKTIKAKKGDGIYKILNQHGLDPSIYFDSFIELNKRNIGRNNSLYIGRDYKLPAKPEDIIENAESGTSVDYPIFGSKYSKVEIIDDQLKGTVYYLVAGHGGPDPGALGKYGNYTLPEDEYAYDVTLRLARSLISHGALVYLIVRDKNDGIRDESILKIDRDEVSYPNLTMPLNPLKRLKQRTDAINKLHKQHRGKYQRLVVIHLDSNIKSEDIDVFFYYHERSRSGKKLAQKIHKTLNDKYKEYQPNRGYNGSISTRSSLYMLRKTDPPTVFIELGNINNPRDQQRFVLYNNREALAKWIGEGIIKDYKSK